jgi:hypothetical protein
MCGNITSELKILPHRFYPFSPLLDVLFSGGAQPPASAFKIRNFIRVDSHDSGPDGFNISSAIQPAIISNESTFNCGSSK